MVDVADAVDVVGVVHFDHCAPRVDELAKPVCSLPAAIGGAAQALHVEPQPRPGPANVRNERRQRPPACQLPRGVVHVELATVGVQVKLDPTGAGLQRMDAGACGVFGVPPACGLSVAPLPSFDGVLRRSSFLRRCGGSDAASGELGSGEATAGEALIVAAAARALEVGGREYSGDKA